MTEAQKPAPAPKVPPKKMGLTPEQLAAYKNIWVAVEMERGKVHPVSWELLGEGRRLADELGVDLGAVVFGPDAPETMTACEDAIAYGADLVYVVRDIVLESYRTQAYTDSLADLVHKHKPDILMLGATPLGRDLAGSVATTLKTGLTADCTELAIDPDSKNLAATRPTFGGSLLCTIMTMDYRPQMATIRPRVMAMPERDDSRKGRIIPETTDVRETDVITKILEFIPDKDQDDAQLAYADVVVAGGLGLGSAENFELIKSLAATLGAEWGGSRPCVQKGWITADRQIGQTGKTIRPKLYICAGISGAIQHRVGVEGSDLIIAINTDPDAPIFEFADIGIVADAMEILPALERALAERLHARTAA